MVQHHHALRCQSNVCYSMAASIGLRSSTLTVLSLVEAGMPSSILCVGRHLQLSGPASSVVGKGPSMGECSPLKGLVGAVGAGVGALVGVFGFRLHCLHAGRIFAKRTLQTNLLNASRRWWTAAPSSCGKVQESALHSKGNNVCLQKPTDDLHPSLDSMVLGTRGAHHHQWLIRVHAS